MNAGRVVGSLSRMLARCGLNTGRRLRRQDRPRACTCTGWQLPSCTFDARVGSSSQVCAPAFALESGPTSLKADCRTAFPVSRAGAASSAAARHSTFTSVGLHGSPCPPIPVRAGACVPLLRHISADEPSSSNESGELTGHRMVPASGWEPVMVIKCGLAVFGGRLQAGAVTMRSGAAWVSSSAGTAVSMTLTAGPGGSRITDTAKAKHSAANIGIRSRSLLCALRQSGATHSDVR